MRHKKNVYNGSIKRASLSFLMLFFCVMIFTACKAFTVVRIDKQADGKGTPGINYNDPSFDPVGYVNTIWDSKVIPFLQGKAWKIEDVLNALKGGSEQAGSKYGVRTTGTNNSWNFIITGKGKVLTINTESRAGFMDIDLPPYDNKKDLSLAIGPVFKGSSIRDSLDFIKFEEFKNQIQYAQLANAFNKKVYDTVISTANINRLVNQEINFTGTFTFEEESVVVTPIQVGLMKEGSQ